MKIPDEVKKALSRLIAEDGLDDFAKKSGSAKEAILRAAMGLEVRNGTLNNITNTLKEKGYLKK